MRKPHAKIGCDNSTLKMKDQNNYTKAKIFFLNIVQSAFPFNELVQKGLNQIVL